MKDLDQNEELIKELCWGRKADQRHQRRRTINLPITLFVIRGTNSQGVPGHFRQAKMRTFPSCGQP